MNNGTRNPKRRQGPKAKSTTGQQTTDGSAGVTVSGSLGKKLSSSLCRQTATRLLFNYIPKPTSWPFSIYVFRFDAAIGCGVLIRLHIVSVTDKSETSELDEVSTIKNTKQKSAHTEGAEAFF